MSVTLLVSQVSNHFIVLCLLSANTHCKFVVLLKSQSVTSISSKSVAHNEDVLHHIALVNVDGIFHHLADIFFRDVVQ